MTKFNTHPLQKWKCTSTLIIFCFLLLTMNLGTLYSKTTVNETQGRNDVYKNLEQQGVDGVYQVYNSNATGPGSLMEAIEISNSNDENLPHSIIFDPANAPYDITLEIILPHQVRHFEILKSLTIDANNLVEKPIIRYSKANYNTELFHISTDNVKISNLEIRIEGSGNIIRASSSTERLSDITVENCIIIRENHTANNVLYGVVLSSVDNVKITNNVIDVGWGTPAIYLSSCTNVVIGDNSNNGNILTGGNFENGVIALRKCDGKVSGNTVNSTTEGAAGIYVYEGDVIVGGESKDEGNIVNSKKFISIDCFFEPMNLVVKNNYFGLDRLMNRFDITPSEEQKGYIVISKFDDENKGKVAITDNDIAIFNGEYLIGGDEESYISKNNFYGKNGYSVNKLISFESESCTNCQELRKAPEISNWNDDNSILEGTIGTRISEYADGDGIEIYSFDPLTQSSFYIGGGTVSGTGWISEPLTIPSNVKNLIANLTHANSTSEFSTPYELVVCPEISPVIIPSDAKFITSACDGSIINGPITLSTDTTYAEYLWFIDANGDNEYTTGDGSGDIQLGTAATLDINAVGAYHLKATNADDCSGVNTIEMYSETEPTISGIYYVANTLNSGEGSLRAAIEASNDNDENLPHQILFCESIAGLTLKISGSLPTITKPVSIDGSLVSQSPLIIMEEFGPSTGESVFILGSDNISIIGLQLKNPVLWPPNAYPAISTVAPNSKAINTIRIENVTITDFRTGISLSNVSGGTITDVTIECVDPNVNHHQGIFMGSCDNILIGVEDKGFTIFNMDIGMYMLGSMNVVVQNSELYHNTGYGASKRGIEIENSSNIDIGGVDPEFGNYISGYDQGIYCLNYKALSDPVQIRNNYFGITKEGISEGKSNTIDVSEQYSTNDNSTEITNNYFYRENTDHAITVSYSHFNISKNKFFYTNWDDTIKPIRLENSANNNKQAPSITEFSVLSNFISGSCDFGNTALENDVIEIYALVPGDKTVLEYVGRTLVASDGIWEADNLTFPTGTTHALATISDYENKNDPYTENTSEFSTPFKDTPIAYPISWTDITGVTVTGNSLKKNTTIEWWNAGAASTGAIPAGEDGWIEMTVTETNTHRMFGLSRSNLNSSWNTIEYNFYLMNTGVIRIYEGGTYINFNAGSYKIGDKARVERLGNKIQYKLNGAIIHTSTTNPNISLLADTSLYTPGATITDARASFNSDPILVNYPICWTDIDDVTVTGNSLKKNTTVKWWNAGAASTGAIPAGENGWIEMTATETNTYRMFGLSHSNPNSTWNTIKYNFYLKQNGGISIYESGVSQTFTARKYKVGDKVRIERSGNNIHYKLNGSIIYTSTTDPSVSLLADTSLYTPGATITDATASFDCSSSENTNTIAYGPTPEVKSEANPAENVAFEWSLYPNPNKGKFTLDFGAPVEQVNVQIYSITSAIVYEKQVGNEPTKRIDVDLSYLPKGMYFINTSIKDLSTTKKLIIE